MGQTQSKRASDSSTLALTTLTPAPYTELLGSPTITSPSSPTSPTTPITPASVITPPAPPKRIYRISECIDPHDVIDGPFTDDDALPKTLRARHPTSTRTQTSATLPTISSQAIVESPSGNLLTAEEFMAHGERPLSMRERQERIARGTREKLESRIEIRASTRAEIMNKEQGEKHGKLSGKRRCCWCCWR